MLGKHCGIELWPHCPHQITSLKLAVTESDWIGRGRTLKFLPKIITFLAVALVWWSIQASAFFSCMCFLWHLPGSFPAPYNLQMAHQKALPSNISCILTKQLPHAAFLSEPDHPSTLLPSPVSLMADIKLSQWEVCKAQDWVLSKKGWSLKGRTTVGA